MSSELLEKFSFIEIAVLSTVMYYDVFDYPLTAMEIYKWLYAPHSSEKVSFVDVYKELEKSRNLAQYLESSDGFWFLKGRESLVNLRKYKNKIAMKKFQYAIFLMKFFRFTPFLRAVFITNTLSYGNTRPDSDIDLFVVCEDKKLWTVRFFFVGLLRVFGMRPGQDISKNNTMCLNFFVSTQRLNIEYVALRNSNEKNIDVHLAGLLRMLVPIYDPQNYYQKCIIENNWIHSFFVNFVPSMPHDSRQVVSGLGVRFLKKTLEGFFGFSFVEKFVKDYQLKIIPLALKQAALRVDSDVMITEDLLKFHIKDKRREVLHLFNQRYNNFIASLQKEEDSRFFEREKQRRVVERSVRV